jgi:HlyD family secretion protein
MNKFLSFFKKKAVYIPLGALILIGAGVSVYGATHKPVYETAKVEKRAFTEEVSVTGKVVAANDVELGFESGGRVTSIPVSVGTKVSKGRVLALVNSADLSATLLDQHARLDSARATLAEVQRGTRAGELNALEDILEQNEEKLEAAVRDSYAEADDNLRSRIDVLYTNPTGSYPKFVDFGSGFKRDELERQRVEIGDMLKVWKKNIDQLEIEGYKESYRLEAETNLKRMRDYLDDLAVASSYFKQSESITEAEVEVYIANISAARGAINATITALNSANLAYIQAQNNLKVSNEGSSPEEIARAQASVKSAEANVLQARAALAKTAIVAPFAGVITKIDLKVGQLASPGDPVISMISNANFQIESYIPEADIAKVKVGHVGTTTLDAYGDTLPFNVVVTAIDLSETEVEGVSTYKTTLQFLVSDDRIRSGMTANIDLVSETREEVLSIPQSALISQAGKRTVMIMNTEGKAEVRDVRTGSIDNSGNIEITEGLSEGEVVITNPEK